MRFALAILLAVFAWLPAANAAQGGRASPLAQPVKHFTTSHTTVLAALVQLGLDAHVSFGLEFYGDLDDPIQIEITHSTVAEVVRRILRKRDAYRLFVLDGVVIVRRKEVPAPYWFRLRIPVFRAPRGDLMTVNVRLSFAVNSALNPRAAGVVGDYMPSQEQVGPFNERGRTLEQLLAKLVAASPRSAIWYPPQYVQIPPGRVSSGNELWVLATY